MAAQGRGAGLDWEGSERCFQPNGVSSQASTRQNISKEAPANSVFWPVLAEKVPGNKCVHTDWMASTAFYRPGPLRVELPQGLLSLKWLPENLQSVSLPKRLNPDSKLRVGSGRALRHLLEFHS